MVGKTADLKDGLLNTDWGRARTDSRIYGGKELGRSGRLFHDLFVLYMPSNREEVWHLFHCRSGAACHEIILKDIIITPRRIDSLSSLVN